MLISNRAKSKHLLLVRYGIIDYLKQSHLRVAEKRFELTSNVDGEKAIPNQFRYQMILPLA